MQMRKKQLGAGMWGLLYILGTAGFALFIFFKAYPVYMNELDIATAVRGVASEGPEGAAALDRALHARWAINSIEILEPKDVVIASTENGKVLQYDYWYQVELIEGIYLSFNFKNEYPLGGAKY